MPNILICNAGSSSLKFKIFHHNQDAASPEFKVLTEGQFTKVNTPQPNFTIKVEGEKHSQDFTSPLSMEEILLFLKQQITQQLNNLKIDTIGHRVVHGGDIYCEPTIVTPEVISNLKKLVALSPIHLPHNISPMELCGKIFADAKQVACFDTAFHSTIGKLQYTYALPRELCEKQKIRRYGFHGLSYEYLISELAHLDKSAATSKVVVAHLGAGASVCAIKDGKSVDTSMGLTPLEGLVMGTRCGSIDPAIVLHLIKQGLSYEEITDILYFKSGLLGVSQISSDFVAISTSKDPQAVEAYQLFVQSVVKNILSMIATLKGVEAIVFSGGIGENSVQLRADVLKDLAWLGLDINESANQKGDTLISTASSNIKIFVIPTQEELVIARQVTLRS